MHDCVLAIIHNENSRDILLGPDEDQTLDPLCDECLALAWHAILQTAPLRLLQNQILDDRHTLWDVILGREGSVIVVLI